MTYVAKYRIRSQTGHAAFGSVSAAVEFLLEELEVVGAYPLGVWEGDEKILSHDDVLEYGEDDETV